jgi:beta-ribofuranosylaminobenzene 5'-phosphate synthase
MPHNSVCICVQPRIHLGLLSMHGGAPRLNGGVGFAVDQPTARIEVAEASHLSVQDNRQVPMAPCELTQLSRCVEAFALKHRLSACAEIRITGDMLTHVGMGSATGLRLGAIEALAILNNFVAVRQVLVAASERGGTSGIGINSYFDGGLLCDLGRPNDGQRFVPSSTAWATRLPFALPPVAMPGWPLLLCIPRWIRPKTQQEEIAFFERTTPLPAPASFEASYVALFEIYAAAAESDYSAFCRGVMRMQQTAWKRAERGQYGDRFETLAATLEEAGADCVGMSSLGPMLFCFAPPAGISGIANVASVMDCDVYPATPANRGRKLSIGQCVS